MPSGTASAPKGPALTFDPRYVDYVIAAWLDRKLAPVNLADLEELTRVYAERDLTTRNEMGLLEEEVSAAAVTKAIALLKALKLAKQALSGPKGAKIARLAATPEGAAILGEPVATAGLRPRLVRLLVARSPELQTLLNGFEQGRDLVVPAAAPVDGAPRKGAAYTRAVEEGLAAFAARVGGSGRTHAGAADEQPKAKKPSAKQQLDAARARAAENHPSGKMKLFEKLLPLAAAMGLVWTDEERLNDVVVATHIGSAARTDTDGYAPNAPTWEEAGHTFLDQLDRAQRARADSTGFATIEALRGELGRMLRLSAAVVDALICRAREAGERGEAPVAVHFEEDEERMYTLGRAPLIWRGHAFDFVEVKAAVPMPR